MNELKSKALRSYGYEGSLNDMEDAFYGGSDINTGEMTWLATLGFTQPQLNDRRKAYLISLGFSGSLNDMLRAALVNDVYYDWGGAALSLNFAASETLDSKITFTRASSALRTNASGVLESVAINVPRIDYDPITHACKGLLIEEARTNLSVYSNDFRTTSQAGETRPWVLSGLIMTTAGTADSPLGAGTATKLVLGAGISFGSATLNQKYSKSAESIFHTKSIYLKSGEFNSCRIFIRDTATSANYGNCIINLSTGTFSLAPRAAGTFSNASGEIENKGDGWYRLALTVKTGTETAIQASIYCYNMTGSAGDGTSGIYIAGSQFEQAKNSSSYIPTANTTATRSADLVSIDGTDFSSWYNQSEGTFVITGDCFAKTDEDNAYITVGDGTSSNFQSVIGNNGGTYQLKLNTYSGGVLQASPATANNAYLQTGNAVKFAFGYKADDVCLATYLNNTTATDTSATIPTVDRAFIGAYYASGNNTLNGHISSIKYYATKLPNKVIRMLGREL